MIQQQNFVLNHLRRLGNVHLDIGQGLRPEDILKEPLRPHAALGLLGQAGHGLDALDGKKAAYCIKGRR